MAGRAEGPNTSGIPVSADQLPTGTVYYEPGDQRLRVSVVAGATPVGFELEHSEPGERVRKNRLRVLPRTGSTPSKPRPGHGRIVTRKYKLSIDEITSGMRRAAARDQDPAFMNTLIDGLTEKIRK